MFNEPHPHDDEESLSRPIVFKRPDGEHTITTLDQAAAFLTHNFPRPENQAAWDNAYDDVLMAQSDYTEENCARATRLVEYVLRKEGMIG